MSKYIGTGIYAYVLRPEGGVYFKLIDEVGKPRIVQTVNPTGDDWDTDDVLLLEYINVIMNRYNKSIVDTLYATVRNNISNGFSNAVGKDFTSSDNVTWNAGVFGNIDTTRSLRVSINDLRDAHQLAKDLGLTTVTYKDINNVDRVYDVLETLPTPVREIAIYVSQCYSMKHICYVELDALISTDIVDVNVIRNYDYTAKYNSIPNNVVPV